MEKEVSCINSNAILSYIKAHNNGNCSFLLENLDPDIDGFQDSEAFLSDSNNWISSAVASKLYKRARLFLNDEMTAYKIARFAIERTDLGFRSLMVKIFGSYDIALKNVQRINAKWNRNKSIEVIKTQKNEAIIRLHWNSEMEVSKDICLYNQGIYTFMPILWGGQPTHLKEHACYFEDAPYCEYHLTWKSRKRFFSFVSNFYQSKSVLMETIKEIEKSKEIIEQKYAEVNHLNIELNQKIRQLTAIQETGKAILSVLDLKKLLAVIMNLLTKVCQINQATIMLVNEKKKCLEYQYGVSYGGEVPANIKDYKVPLDRLSNILVRVASTGQSEYIPEVKRSKLRKSNLLLTQAKPTSVYVVPLITRSKVIGVIATDAVGAQGVPQETRETLEIFAPQIAIAIQNAKLYKYLEERMTELEQSRALLSRAEKLSYLGNLAARLAHEIKNPLTAIGTFLQLLPKKFDDEEFRTEFYQIALEETNRVNNLITELLDLSKPRETRFELDDLNGLIEKMVLLVSPQSKAKGIQVTTRFDPSAETVWMDSEKIKQVILNLLSNAIDFTPQAGKIEIITRSRKERDGSESIDIEVTDTGEGIPRSSIDSIFDPYFTTKHKSSMHSGTGLGLFIADQNIENHGGTIEVRSKVNQGTTFIVRLPKSKP